MKKIILNLAIIALAIPSANAQWWSGNEKINGNGNYISETRSVSDYDAVSVQGSIHVELIAGTEGRLKVEAESNLLEHILTEVEGDRLKISIEKGYNLSPSSRNEIKVTVPFESLEEVSLTGSGDIVGSDKINAENFKVDITGSGDVALELQARFVKGSLTGSGNIRLKGKTQQLESKVTGSGDFDASNLIAAKVEANVSGSGDIEVYASQELKSRVSGSGDIIYSGNPKKQDFKTSGSGSISKG